VDVFKPFTEEPENTHDLKVKKTTLQSLGVKVFLRLKIMYKM
jgi:hypothetical protein